MNRKSSLEGEAIAARVSEAFSVISADFNSDGIPDLAAITPGPELLVLLGVDGARYRRSFRCRLDDHARGLLAADLDGDGILDLAVDRPHARGFNLFRGLGDGTFARPSSMASRTPTTWSLTPREQEVARLAATGYTCVEIARALGISRRTAETHVAAIRSKLDLKSKRELVQRATSSPSGG
jgi:DNA-binding CsgD family transcriptional regulator